MVGEKEAPASESGRWPHSTQVVVFRETLVGGVRATSAAEPAGGDRTHCAVAEESVLAAPEGTSAPLAGCVLENLVIAIDAGTVNAEGGLTGVVRSGSVHVEGLPALKVLRGEFELFPRVPQDARRMRYRLWLGGPYGGRWYLSGTKLVVNEASGWAAGRAWFETTTLYIRLDRLSEAGGSSDASAERSHIGVVRVRPADFARQLLSLRGEPGPSGGARAVLRLAATFWSVLAEVYLNRTTEASFAPGIGVAFGTGVHRPDPDDERP